MNTKQKYTLRRQQRRHRLRKSRSQRRRRIMYGGNNNALDTYAASPMNPGWPIGGMNNFVGPTQIAMDAKPVSMI